MHLVEPGQLSLEPVEQGLEPLACQRANDDRFDGVPVGITDAATLRLVVEHGCFGVQPGPAFDDVERRHGGRIEPVDGGHDDVTAATQRVVQQRHHERRAGRLVVHLVVLLSEAHSVRVDLQVGQLQHDGPTAAGAELEHAPHDQHVKFDVGASGGEQRLPERFDLHGGVGAAFDVGALLDRNLERKVLVDAADSGVVDGEAVQRTDGRTELFDSMSSVAAHGGAPLLCTIARTHCDALAGTEFRPSCRDLEISECQLAGCTVAVAAELVEAPPNDGLRVGPVLRRTTT